MKTKVALAETVDRRRSTAANPDIRRPVERCTVAWTDSAAGDGVRGFVFQIVR